jgi:hypothetical protein
MRNVDSLIPYRGDLLEFLTLLLQQLACHPLIWKVDCWTLPVLMILTEQVGSSSNTSDLCSWGTWFEFRPRHRLSWQEFRGFPRCISRRWATVTSTSFLIQCSLSCSHWTLCTLELLSVPLDKMQINKINLLFSFACTWPAWLVEMRQNCPVG